MKILTIGADPECFIRASDGTAISSYGIIGGSKESPRPMKSGFYVQEDNVMVEFNIPPSSTRGEFISNIVAARSQINTIIPKNSRLEFIPTVEFEDDALNTEGAQTFGCSPDNDAYMSGNFLMPVSLEAYSFRCAGGHVHVGIENSKDLDTNEICDFVKTLDLFLAVPSLLKDLDDNRRSFYGTPGRFRPKPYGLEYRTLSNFWAGSPKETGWVYDNVKKAEEFHNTVKISDELAFKVKKTCLSLDRKLAEELSKEYSLL